MELDLIQLQIIIWIPVIIVDNILGILMLYKTLRIEGEITKKKYFTALTLFFFTHSTCRVFFFLQDFFIPEFIILAQIAAILGILSVTWVVSAIESAIYTKTKHFFTGLGLLGVSLDILDIFSIVEFDFSVFAQTYFTTTLTVFIILIYFSHIWKSTETVRNHFIVMTLGIIIFGTGEMGNTSIAIRLFWWAFLAAPIFMLVGILVIFYGIVKFYKEPQPSTDVMDNLER